MIKVDNGYPFAEPGQDTVPPLALWLIGLGIEMIWNRAFRPTDNAQVERMQAVTANWAEPKQCPDLDHLEAQLETVCQVQRSHYRCRHLGGRTRCEVFAGLEAGGIAYGRLGFKLDRVIAFLAQGHWVRRVSKTGQFTLYKHRYSVGRSHAGTSVWVQLDAEHQQWVVTDRSGVELKRFALGFITRLNLWRLSLDQRTDIKT